MDRLTEFIDQAKTLRTEVPLISATPFICAFCHADYHKGAALAGTLSPNEHRSGK